MEKLNILAEKLADDSRKYKTVPYHPLASHNHADFRIHGNSIYSEVSTFEKKIYALQFIQEKHDFTNKAMDLIWWDLYALPLSHLSHNVRLFIKNAYIITSVNNKKTCILSSNQSLVVHATHKQKQKVICYHVEMILGK